ncbi:hypothetical protein IFT47_19620 [Pseudomonas sp. CFBP 13711]|uniref:hypothetical protein n=1 Tax=unclassified Pseudomonas TaxID=196821 RepID=UPI001785EF16|nr:MULTISPECIES: hypothetical protein [unclassified Pseudomonas]MBD8708841.1 hypothetical protein [Pseudomonas sp. CFBP 13711]MBD8712315.1 hypothetical protein [Pseudomonas sp. CFBP 13715]
MKIERATLMFMCLSMSTGLSADFSLSSSADNTILTARVDGHEFKYPDIIGDQDGLWTTDGLINNAPALYVLGRDSYYYTLKTHAGGVHIDCAYADARNSTNGARVLAGMCGLDERIIEDFQVIAQNYSNDWQDSVYGFDTWPMISNKTSGDFLLGKIGEVEVYDRYASIDDLLNAKPEKYVKTSSGCYYFKQKLAFLVFNKPRPDKPVFLDVIRSHDPFLLDRLTEAKLTKMAVRKCR